MSDVALTKFKFEHIGMIEDAVGRQLMPLTEAVHLERYDTSFTAFDGDRVIGCAGLIPIWKNRYIAWAHVDTDAFAKNKVWAIRTIKRYLDMVEGRVEAAVPEAFEEGFRLAKALGFRVECVLAEKYFANGTDARLYVRIN